jgi:hypothetical protein
VFMRLVYLCRVVVVILTPGNTHWQFAMKLKPHVHMSSATPRNVTIYISSQNPSSIWWVPSTAQNCMRLNCNINTLGTSQRKQSRVCASVEIYSKQLTIRHHNSLLRCTTFAVGIYRHEYTDMNIPETEFCGMRRECCKHREVSSLVTAVVRIDKRQNDELLMQIQLIPENEALALR